MKQLSLAEGRGKGGASKHAGKRKGAPLVPKTREQMTSDDRWWLRDYWNGNLWRAMKDANASCS